MQENKKQSAHEETVLPNEMQAADRSNFMCIIDGLVFESWPIDEYEDLLDEGYQHNGRRILEDGRDAR